MLYLGEVLLKQGCKPTFLLGARSKNDLLQLEQFEALGDVYTTTEDGSMGEKGYVTMHSVLKAQKFDMIYTCGPKPMMMAVAKYAKQRASNARCHWKTPWPAASEPASAAWKRQTRDMCAYVKKVRYLI